MQINGLAWVPNIVSVILTFLIFMAGALIYMKKIKKFQKGEVVSGYCLVIEIFVNWCRKTTVQMGGEKMKWAAPYFAFLIIYISINNLVAVLGIANAITQLTVPLALGSVTFMMLFFMAIRYRNKEFLKEYINPAYWLTQFSPLISISFRLFGNILSGVIVTGMLYSATSLLWEFIPIIGQINILGGFLAPPFHFYFDLFEGILQSYVFAVLTISYWGGAAGDNNRLHKIDGKRKIKINRQIKLK